MRRDLIIGILVSLLLHGGIGFGSYLFKGKPKIAEKIEEPPAILIEIPEVPPEEPEPTEVIDATEVAAQLAPPTLVDVPGVVDINSIVQPIQPPAPPNMGAPTGIVNIPTGPVNSGAIGKGLGEIFDLKNLDQQPAVKFQANPAYPYELKRQGVTGEVLVEFVVDHTGNVREARAVRSTNSQFEAAAVQAVMKWKFRPGRKGGRNVNVRMHQPITFNITD